MASSFLFYLSAAATLLAAAGVVLQKRTISSALSLILCMGGVALLYVQLQATLVAAIQIIIYAGAIMVLFLFVIMLLDPASEQFSMRPGRIAYFAIPLGILVALLLIHASMAYRQAPTAGGQAAAPDVASLGLQLFSRYLLPFEVTSVLILVAVIGAVVLAKKKL